MAFLKIGQPSFTISFSIENNGCLFTIPIENNGCLFTIPEFNGTQFCTRDITIRIIY